MDSYDSDSSGAEDGDYTETNVLLGYASKEPTDDTTSQLGGHPTWLDENTPPSGSLAKCKVCNGYLTLLLQLNGDLPERFPGHERRLYLFGCRRKACRRKEGSIRGFRAVRASNIPEPKQQPAKAQQAKPSEPEEPEEPAAQKPTSNIGASLFGVKPASSSGASSNPFSTGNSSSSASTNPFASPSSSSSNPFAGASSLAAKPAQPPTQPQLTLSETFASKARISSPPPSDPSPPAAAAAKMGPAEPWPPRTAFPAPYPHYHLDADYETLDAPKNEIPSNARIDMDIDGGEGSSNSTSISDDNKANFESAMDTTFQKFADRMAQNPEQVLRYEFAGVALLYAKTDAVGKKLSAAQEGGSGASAKKVQVQVQAGKSGMPRCENCGGDRIFELQLAPYAIVELEAEELGLEGMEWGTVILGVCAKDCVARGVKQGEVGYVEEWAGVQWEEQVSRK